MFTYQRDTKSLFVAECGKKDFWREIKKASTPFNINTRREILQAVDAQDEAVLKKWEQHEDYQKFIVRTMRSLKSKSGKEKWQVGFYDALMLAAANESGCATIYTEDLNDGQRYGNVVARNPFTVPAQ